MTNVEAAECGSNMGYEIARKLFPANQYHDLEEMIEEVIQFEESRFDRLHLVRSAAFKGLGLDDRSILHRGFLAIQATLADAIDRIPDETKKEILAYSAKVAEENSNYEFLYAAFCATGYPNDYWASYKRGIPVGVQVWFYEMVNGHA